MSQHVVCLRCARIKQACDGGSPCARCRRLDLHCEPKEYASQSTEGGLLTLKRAKITRTHTGCLTCKKRRRKCDESRPRCSDCRRLCLDCKYANPTAQQPGNPQPLKEPIEQDSLSVVKTPILEVEAFDKTILDFDGDIITEMFDSDGWDTLMEHSPLIPYPRVPSYTSNSGSPPISLPELSLVAISTAPDLSVDEDKALLNHYMKVVASVLSRRDDRRTNPYLSKVLPIALQNQLVMNAVLALSASHWRKLQPSISRRGTIHQTNGKPQPPAMHSSH
jgi:transcriptional activator protein UGA3